MSNEITHLPPGAVLAGLQCLYPRAVGGDHPQGRPTFWACNITPNTTMHEMARLTWCRIEKLVKLGFFRDAARRELRHPAGDPPSGPQPPRHRLALGIDDDVINEDIRLT